MPYWINTPDGPQYVDEFGQPADPNQFGAAPPASPSAPAAVEPVAAAPVAPQPPAPVPLQPSPLPAPPPGQSYGVNQGESGFATPRYQAVTATQGRLGAQQAAAAESAQAGAAEESRRAAALAGDQAAGAQGVFDVQSEQEAAHAEHYREQARMASMFAAAESTAQGLAMERTTGYRARYEQALSAAHAMSLKPGLDASPTDSVGMGVALFAQGFLGAQGVPVADVRGMVNQMIDRRMDLQMEQIRRGERLAESQRVLWDMARSEADDESEARDRMRGLMMAQAASQMEATTAQFGSRLATAKGQAAAADIRAELSKHLGQISDRYFQRYMTQSGLALDQWKAEVNASMESRRIGLDARRVAVEEKKAGQGASGLGDVVFDVTESGGREAKWQFIPGLGDAKKGELLDRMAGKATFLANLRELRGMAAEAGTQYNGWGNAMANEAFAKRVRNITSGLSASYVRAMSGATATDNERKTLADRLPINGILQRDGDRFVREGLSDFQAEVIRETQNTIGQFATDIPAGSPLSGLKGGSPSWGGAEQVEADVIRSGRGEEKTPVQSALERVLIPNAQKEAESAPVSDLWRAVGNQPRTHVDTTQVGGLGANPTAETMPGWATALEDIYRVAGDPWGVGTDRSQEAYNALANVEQSSNDPEQRDYANDLMWLIIRDRDERGLPRPTVSDFSGE